jgi:hypothetical protein
MASSRRVGRPINRLMVPRAVCCLATERSAAAFGGSVSLIGDVDAEGLANGAKFTDVCVFPGVVVTLDSLVDNGNLQLT